MSEEPKPRINSNLPSREEIIKAIEDDLKSRGEDAKEISFSMTEEILVFGLTGGFLHNLEMIDDPLFITGANETMGTHVGGQPLPPEDLVCSKVPMSLTGYGLVDGKDDLIGFACLGSQIGK